MNARKRTHSAPVHCFQWMGLLTMAIAIVSATGILLAQVQEGGDTVTGESGSKDGADGEQGNVRRGVKPTRLSAEERDRREAESAQRERVGNIIGGACEALSDAGEECDFEALKEQALARLGSEVAALYAEEGEQQGPQLGCFDVGGNVTNDRMQCAQDQSGFFGMPEESDTGEFEEEDGAFDQDVGYSFPSEEDMMQYGNQYYAPPPPAMHPSFQGNFEEPGGVEQIGLMMDIAKTMMPKLRKVIAIFEREGVEVPAESRQTAEKAIATFERLEAPCRKGDMTSCQKLATTMESLEGTMRPPMEQAMQRAVMSGKIGFDRIQGIGMEIETMMNEGMEGMMGPPPGMMHQGYGSPGMMNQGYGPPGGMMQQGYGPSSGYGQMPSGYGPPSGYGGMPGGYGPPPWEQ